jgi:hypothetical protein
MNETVTTTIFDDFLKKAFQENEIFTVYDGKKDLVFIPVKKGAAKLLYSFIQEERVNLLNDEPKLVGVVAGGRLISRGLEKLLPMPAPSENIISLLSYGKILNETEVKDYVQSVFDELEPIFLEKEEKEYPALKHREYLSEEEVLEVICGADVGALVEKKLDRTKMAKLKGMEFLAERNE